MYGLVLYFLALRFFNEVKNEEAAAKVAKAESKQATLSSNYSDQARRAARVNMRPIFDNYWAELKDASGTHAVDRYTKEIFSEVMPSEAFFRKDYSSADITSLKEWRDEKDKPPHRTRA